MGYLVKETGSTVTDPGAPSQPAVLAIPFRLYGAPAPYGMSYRQQFEGDAIAFGGGLGGPPWPNSPDDFPLWSQLDTTVPDAWWGPIAHMQYIKFDAPGVSLGPTGFPLGPGPFVGYFEVPTATGVHRETRTYFKNGPHGTLTPYGAPFTDPPLCTTGGPCGVTMLAGFPGRPAIPGIPPTITTDYHEGWNAGANSVEELDGDLRTLFQPQIEVALACGFGHNRTDVTSFANLTHAFYFDRGDDGAARAWVMENGIIVAGPFVPDVFMEIRRESNVITYRTGDVLFTTLHVSASLSFGPLRVGSAFYRAGDGIL